MIPISFGKGYYEAKEEHRMANPSTSDRFWNKLLVNKDHFNRAAARDLDFYSRLIGINRTEDDFKRTLK